MDNTNLFSGKAGGYSKYRPTYPDALYELLYGTTGMAKDSVIADIGAGTGIFSRGLLERGSKVYCVEPNDDMLSQAKVYLQDYQHVEFINATADATTLADNSVDFITAAQAFHWFDRQAFRAECQRILKPAGKVILVWNSRVETRGIVLDLAVLNKRLCPEFHGFSGGKDEDPASYDDFFGERCEYHCIANNFEMSRQQFIGSCLSSSYTPRTGEPDYDEYIRALGEIFDNHAHNGTAFVPYNTDCYIGGFN